MTEKRVIPYITATGNSGYRVETKKKEKKSFWKIIISIFVIL